MPIPDPTVADDTSFDLIYPHEVRAFSSRFWTPVDVARAAAELLRKAGAHRVLDVGSGVGKFALAAAAAVPDMQLVGIEQREHLVAIARAAAERLELANVRFEHGDATSTSWLPYDGYYFFNPFAENLFHEDGQLDDRVELTREKFFADVLRVENTLRAAPLGTSFVTYHGMGGRIPATYDLVEEVEVRTDWLRLWIKSGAVDDGSFCLELESRVVLWRAGTLGPAALVAAAIRR
jgi:SAM-dependent methyltransferase